MQLNSFMAELKHRDGIKITDSVILFRRPCELYDLNTDTVIAQGNKKNKFDGAIFDAHIGKYTLRQIIESWEHLPVEVFDGGNGGNSAFTQTGYPSGGTTLGKLSPTDYPARMNIRVENQQKTLDFFREKHANDSKESAILVDERGFTHTYAHGEADAVAVDGSQMNNMMMYHNHPAAGWPVFSREDLIAMATTGSRGIDASSGLKGRSESTAKYAGDYIVTKTNKFNANGFVKALNTAKLSGKDLNDASTKWLRANQKKYGYKFEYRKG